MSRVLMFSVALGMLFFLSSCGQEEIEVTETGYVEATDAYLESFGEPPQGKKGRGYARVAYLPLKNEPGKVSVFPVYLFSEGYHLPKILERLTSTELLLPENTELYKPFPDDLEIVAEPPVNGLQQISLLTQQSWGLSDQTAAATAFAETALQFPDVDRVFILVNGQPLPVMPENGFVHNPQSIAALGPPSLILIAAAWETGNQDPDELMVEFDRPIKVNNFQLFGPEGKKVEGEYYTSIFQMAIIVHPKEPGLFKEGVVMKAEWDVVDTLGRVSQGTKNLALHRYDH